MHKKISVGAIYFDPPCSSPSLAQSQVFYPPCLLSLLIAVFTSPVQSVFVPQRPATLAANYLIDLSRLVRVSEGRPRLSTKFPPDACSSFCSLLRWFRPATGTRSVQDERRAKTCIHCLKNVSDRTGSNLLHSGK